MCISSECRGLVKQEAIATGLEGEAAVGTLVVEVARVRVGVHLQPCSIITLVVEVTGVRVGVHLQPCSIITLL